MSDDFDFDMEVVEDDELDEWRGNSESSSDEQDRLDTEEKRKSNRNESNSLGASVRESPVRHEEGKSGPYNSHSGGEVDVQRFGPFTFDLPEGWRAERQREVKQLFTRGKQPIYADSGVPVINQACIYWDGWHFENLRFLDREEAEDWPEKYFPKKGDIVLNSTGQGTLGRAQVYPDDKRRAVDSHVTILRTASELNPYFHRYFLESHLGQALLYSMCVNGSTGQIELSKTRLDLMPVPIPPLPEQRKIASVLYTVDQAIQKTEAIIEQAKRVKRGLMQDLFLAGTQEHSNFEDIRIGPKKYSIPNSWSLNEVGDFAEVTSSQRIYSSDYVEEGVPFYRSKEIIEKSEGKSPTEDQCITEEYFEELDRKYGSPEKGDILITSVGTTGVPYLVGDEEFYFKDGNLQWIKDISLDSEYISYFMETKIFQDQVQQKTAGSSQGALTIGNLKSTKVIYPTEEEVLEITDRISSVEELIDTSSAEKSRLKSLKKGLMQGLLTGEVRTTGKAIEVLDEVGAHG